MGILVIESWVWLLYCHYLMRFRGFDAVHGAVRDRAATSCRSSASAETLCRAMDLACVFYFKRVWCLQRSAATTILLRRHGWNAELVIGAQMYPSQFHAWVEIDNQVVNDKPYIPEIFQVLERC